MINQSWLLVGCGVQGNRWLNRLGERCKGIVDVRSFNTKGICKFSTVRDSISSGLSFDSALISVSSEWHFELCKILLESGKNVLCEKPMCFTLDQLEILCKLSEVKNKTLGQVTLERFNLNIHNNVEFLQNQKILEFVRLGLKPFHRFEEGPVFDLGIHDIDLYLFFFAEKRAKFRFGYVDKLENTMRSLNGIDLKSQVDQMLPQILMFEDAVQLGYNLLDTVDFLRTEIQILNMIRLEELKNPYETIFDLELDLGGQDE